MHLGPSPAEAPPTSYSVVETPEVPPYAWNGRLYVRQDGKEGLCTATAINSPSRSLVLTAGHCVNTGPRDGRPGIWSSYIEFVPGFNLGAAPFGAWVLSGRPRALPGWIREGNPDFDLGAFLVEPNDEGVPLADAVGGGATIVTDLGHQQQFETYGYPGGTERMRTCASGFAGEDAVTRSFPGPATVAHPLPLGARGERRRLDDRRRHRDRRHHHLPETNEKQRSYGPYFSGKPSAAWSKAVVDLQGAARPFEQPAVVAVVAPVGTQIGRQRQVMAGAAGVAGHAQRPAEAEVRVVVDRMGLDHGAELPRRQSEPPRPVIGAAERLAHRGLLRFATGGLGERPGRVLEVAVLEQLHAAPVERVGRLGLGHRPIVKGRGSGLRA